LVFGFSVIDAPAAWSHPVPDKVTEGLPFEALPAKDADAARAPAALGVNLNCTLTFEPGATETGSDGEARVKSPDCSPLIVIPVIDKGVLPVFVAVIATDAVVCVGRTPKITAVALNCIFGDDADAAPPPPQALNSSPRHVDANRNTTTILEPDETPTDRLAIGESSVTAVDYSSRDRCGAGDATIRMKTRGRWPMRK